MTPYYQDDWVTLWHADNREILPTLADQSVDLVLTDPPYSDEVHRDSKRRYGTRTRPQARKVIDFAPLASAEIFGYFDTFARLSLGWVVSFLADDHTYQLKASTKAAQAEAKLNGTPYDGLTFVRSGVWHKPNSAPHINLDRPSQGWESIAMLHRNRPGKYTWHGQSLGRNHSVFIYPIDGGGEHSTGKPLALVCELVALFSDPGDLILDPFGGRGTTALAAKRLGRRCTIIEQDERYCEIAARRLSQDCMDLEAA